jgi:DNA ligase (NAD+)
MKAWGLPVIPETWFAHGADDLVRVVMNVGQLRAGFAFPTDGAVVKLDGRLQQSAIGASDRAPRWALAYKFAPERVETELRAITLQVGRSGVLTPVAELIPVQIAGSKVARATLHNLDEIARKDLRIGDFVYVEKAGDIIPAVVGVNLERRPANAEPFQFPIACPECYAPVVRSETEAAIRCSNEACTGQLRRRIEHFASKDCVDIEGLGPAMIEALVAEGWVKDLPDLYRLRRADLLTLGKHNEKSVDRLLVAIERSRRVELSRLIHGLGIPGVGAATAKDLARQCGNLVSLAEHGGKAVVVLGEPRFQGLIADLIAVGVDTLTEPAGAGRLAGKTFVLTGTLPNLTRADAAAKIEKAGGKIRATISRTTNYLVVGAGPGTKLTEARTLGVEIIDEPTFLKMIED